MGACMNLNEKGKHNRHQGCFQGVNCLTEGLGRGTRGIKWEEEGERTEISGINQNPTMIETPRNPQVRHVLRSLTIRDTEYEESTAKILSFTLQFKDK